MHTKNVKKYFLTFLIVILPIGGFFVLFQHYIGAKAIKPVQAINSTNDIEVPTLEADIIADVATATVATTEVKNDSVALSAPKTPEPAVKPASCPYPSKIINTTAWKQTLPIGSSGKPTEIKYASLSSYSSDPYFKTNSACDGVIFRAPVNGVTTSGSGYPRSELREMSADGKNLASWSTTSGTNSMFIEQAITAIPKAKKHVVAGQIHDAKDDVIVIRLEYPKLFVDINGKPGPTLDSNYTLGKKFTVKFEASGGQIKVFYNGSTSPSYTMKKATSGNYFKAGAYTQSNCSKEKDCSASNFGEVVIYKLSVQH